MSHPAHAPRSPIFSLVPLFAVSTDFKCHSRRAIRQDSALDRNEYLLSQFINLVCSQGMMHGDSAGFRSRIVTRMN